MKRWSWASSGLAALAVAGGIGGIGCGKKTGVFCDDGAPPSCYEVNLGESQIAILWPDSDKRLDLPLTKTGQDTYTFPNPLGEDRGAVEVRLVDETTIAVKNERDQGEPMIHKRRE